jgi:uncharacterized membrane protein
MASFCSSCGAAMPDGTTVCSACGKSAGAAPAASTGGLDQNVAGMLAYFTIIPAIIFLVVEPYNKNRFIRFHAFQCLFVAAAWVALWFALTILTFIPGVNLLMLIIGPVVAIGGFILFVVLIVKAYQGQKFKLPVIGDMAEKQANTV